LFSSGILEHALPHTLHSVLSASASIQSASFASPSGFHIYFSAASFPHTLPHSFSANLSSTLLPDLASGFHIYFSTHALASLLLLSFVSLFLLSLALSGSGLVSFNLYSLVSSSFNYFIVLLLLVASASYALFSSLYVVFYTVLTSIIVLVLHLHSVPAARLLSSFAARSPLALARFARRARLAPSLSLSRPQPAMSAYSMFELTRSAAPRSSLRSSLRSPSFASLSQARLSAFYSVWLSILRSISISVISFYVPRAPSSSFNLLDLLSLQPFSVLFYLSCSIYFLILAGIFPLYVFYSKLFYVLFLSSASSSSPLRSPLLCSECSHLLFFL